MLRLVVLSNVYLVAVGLVWHQPGVRVRRSSVRVYEAASTLADSPVEESVAVVEEAIAPAETVPEEAPVLEVEAEEKESSSGKKSKAKEGIAVSEIEVGASYEGTVVAVLSYGCFIDIGAQSDGLCHISELSTKFVEDINEVVSVGDTVTARVLKVEADKKQIALSLKTEAEANSSPKGGRGDKRQRSSRDSRPKKAGAAELRKFLNADPTDEVDGTVVTIKPFGAFVRIEDGIDGLVHISRIADERVDSVEDHLQVGQEVKVRIIDVDLEKATLALAMDTYRPPGARGGGGNNYQQQDTQDGGMNARARRAYGAQDSKSTQQRKPKRTDPGDDIWETKESEKFDWQSAMQAAQGDQDDLASGFKVDADGKISMQ